MRQPYQPLINGLPGSCPPSQVEQLDAARGALVADVAGATGALKALVVKAEDARLLGDMGGVKRAYRQLYDLNRWGRGHWRDGGTAAGGGGGGRV